MTHESRQTQQSRQSQRARNDLDLYWGGFSTGVDKLPQRSLFQRSLFPIDKSARRVLY